MKEHANWLECRCKGCCEHRGEVAHWGLMLQRACVELPDSSLEAWIARADFLTDNSED